MASEFHLSGGVFRWTRDSADAGTAPDQVALNGTVVEFRSNLPANKPLPVPGGVIFVENRFATIGADGQLYDEQGNAGIDLIGNDEDFQLPVPVQWQVRISPFANTSGKIVRPAPYWVDAPAPGTSVTIDELTPTPGVEQPGGTQGRIGYSPVWKVWDEGPPRLFRQYIEETDQWRGDPVDYLPDISGEITEKIDEMVPPAVTAEVADRDMIEGGDPRVPKTGELDRFRILDKWGNQAFEITPDGKTKIGTTEISQSDYEGLRIYDDEERIAFDVRPDGTTFIGQLSADSDGRSVLTNVTKVHILIGMGQSNMSGRGLPINAELDPPDARIFQYGANATAITQATVPLDSVDAAYGLSPLTVVAREYAKRLPPGEVILLVPAARGGSAIGYPDSESGSGIWNVAYTGSSQNLYAMAKVQSTAAVNAAAVKWPGATLYLGGMFWHQGESNAGFTEANYASLFDAIVADFRAHMSAPNLPVVLGGMVPEWVAVTPGAENVVAAHVNTPKRLVRTGYAYPPANGGGNNSLSPTEVIHFHRAGVEELGRRMLLAWDRALRNVNPSVPHPPATVTATVNGGTLSTTWSQPITRYTEFIVEKREGGGSWDAITHTTVDTTATATVSTLPVEVRVSTKNEYGTSAPSTPVYATLIKEPA